MYSVDRAILLSGGLGTRLRGLFPDVPKALAPILGKPFIEHQLLWLHSQGINHVHIAAGFMADHIETWFKENKVTSVNVTLSREPKPLGTGGAIKFAAGYVVPCGDSYLVLNGDTLLPHLSISQISNQHDEQQHALTMAVTEIPDASRYGTVILDDRNFACAFMEKSAVTTAGLVNGGVYLIRQRVLDAMPENETCSLEREIFPQLIQSHDIKCYVVPSPLLDMGTPDGHAAMTEYLKKQSSVN